MGDVVLIGGFHRKPYYLVSNPDHLKTVLGLPMLGRGGVLRETLGSSLFMISGEPWLERRRILQPAYNAAENPAYENNIHEVIFETVRRWERYAADGVIIDVLNETLAIARGVIVKMMFGTDIHLAADLLKELFESGMEWNRWRLFKRHLSWPTRRNLRFKRALVRLDEIVYHIIDEYRNDLSNTTFLSALIRAGEDNDGENLTDLEIRDEVMTMFAVGHMTTGAALAWTLYELTRNPDVAAKVRDECAGMLAGRAPTMREAQQLKYTFQVVQESLRLYPPVWSFTRKLAEPLTLGEHTIPQGAAVLLSPYVMHRRHDFWEQPEEFDPQRFTPERIAQRHKFVYLPFGGGKRQCIGRQLATIEIMMVIPALLQKFRLQLIPDAAVEPHPLTTLSPRGKVPMTVQHL
jgi:cytochrome P450